MPRDLIPGVLANRALRRLLVADEGAWWVTCFAVQQGFRGQGVARALLDAAVEHARRHGATALEGHPVVRTRSKPTAWEDRRCSPAR